MIRLILKERFINKYLTIFKEILRNRLPNEATEDYLLLQFNKLVKEVRDEIYEG